MVQAKLSDRLGKVLRASTDLQVLKLQVMLRPHLDAKHLRYVAQSLSVVEGIASITYVLPRCKMGLLTARKRSVPGIAGLPVVLRIDLAKKAPFESLLDSEGAPQPRSDP